MTKCLTFRLYQANYRRFKCVLRPIDFLDECRKNAKYDITLMIPLDAQLVFE